MDKEILNWKNTTSSSPRGFSDNQPLKIMIAWLLIFWIAMAIAPKHRFDWLLENLLVFIYSGILLVTYRRFSFSNTSYLLFTVFMTLHLVGAHYTYAETPFGFWMQDWMGFERNHYDRLVHFSYGLLLAYPFREILVRTVSITHRLASFITVNLVLSFSGFYEVIEAITAMVVSPELGDAYLGTQGDMWDAQWDMGLAMLGAVIAMMFTHMSVSRSRL